MQRKNQRRILVAVIVLGSVGIASLMLGQKPEPEKQTPPSTALLVDTVELESVSTTFTVDSQGTVLPRTETVLSAEVSGTITDVSPVFVAGGVFEAGEQLMRIDPTNYRVALKQAQALLKQRQIEYEGASKLRNQGYRAEADYASAAAALASSEAELVRAERNLERTSIRLPYRGMVRSRAANIGQFVSPGTQLGTAFSIDVAEVRLPLTDRDIAFVDLPEPGRIGSETGPDVILSTVRKGREMTWPARIVRTEGVVDSTSRVTYAVAQVDDPYALESGGNALPIGTFVSAEIIGVSVDDIIRVPRYALRGADELLFVDDESRLQIRQVEVAKTDDRFAYLSAGARAGERVIVTALESPINGTRVRTSESGADQLASRQPEAALD